MAETGGVGGGGGGKVEGEVARESVGEFWGGFRERREGGGRG